MPKLPEYLKSIHYANPADQKPAFFSFAENTDMGMFEWLEHHPEQQRIFQAYQTAKDGVSDFKLKPILERTLGQALAIRRAAGDPPVLFVDVGAGEGRPLREVAASIPDQLAGQGRIVTQDLPQVVTRAPESALVEAMGHDFFTPQPIRGACVYFLRAVLHNWSDAACVRILRHLLDAMEPYSRLVIVDLVMPPTASSRFLQYIDITMMAFGGQERTEGMWRNLLAQVGLRLDKITYEDPTSASADCVIEAVRG
jgi:hypothetical protein